LAINERDIASLDLSIGHSPKADQLSHSPPIVFADEFEKMQTLKKVIL